MPKSSKDEIRENIVADLESSLEARSYGELLLAVGLILATFGSAAALMPDAESVTGEFSGALEVDQPVIEETRISMIEPEDNQLKFILDNEIRNPNIVDADVEVIAFRVESGSNTLKEYSIYGKSAVPPDSSRMISTQVSIDMEKLVTGEKTFEEITSDMKVEGVIRVSSGGEVFDRQFLKRFSVS